MKHLSTNQNNFDLIRFILAFIVFLYHVSVLTQHPGLSVIGKYLSAEIAVDSFFIVSGFLIFMSFENTLSIQKYFLKRLRRILPGYLAVILICSLGLFFISTYTFEDYFSFDWIKYTIVNAFTLNFIQHNLPGVFEGNYLSAVNGALWTIKVEVMFYLVVPVIVILFSKINKLAVMVIIYISAIAYSIGMIYLEGRTGNDLYLILERQIPGQLAFFISGAFLYYYLDEFRRHSKLILISGVILFIFSKMTGFYFLYPATLAILVIYSAMVLRYLGNWGKFGDFSFGIYIWHFPVIQVFVHFRLFESHLYFVFPSLILTVFIISYLSWHLIEKPFLSHHSHYREVEVSEAGH